jgi:hypothetical protein
MRNPFLSIAVLLCLATAALATDQKKDAHTKQTE